MKVFAFFVLVFTCAFGASQATPTNSQTSPSACGSPLEVQKPIVPVLRILNDAEIKFSGAHQRFASLQELLQWDVTKQLAERDGVQLGAADEVIVGYTFKLTVGERGKAYSIIAWKNDGPCKYVGAVSNERGIILLAQPIR